MGAHNFTDHVPGVRSVLEAYRHATQEARSEYGSDAYNGTISTTGGYSQVETLPMTISGANIYAQHNVERAQKWEAALAVPTASDESFTFRTVSFTVTPTSDRSLTAHDVREAGETEAYKRYGTAIHKVEVEPDIRTKVVVSTTAGRPTLKYAIPRGNGWHTYDTKAEAVAAAKEHLDRQSAWESKVEIRAMKVYEGPTTVAVTVERVTTKATGKVTVTLATPRAGAAINGWTFFGWAAC